MEDHIQFIAKFPDWTCIKKIKVEEKTEPKQIMEFLGTLSVSFDNKVEDLLRKEVELEKVDKVLDELLEKGKNANNVSKTISLIGGTKISSVAKEICEQEKWQKNEKKEMIEFIKVYAMRKAMKQIGLLVDYSQVTIPGMKRLLKKKKEKK